MIVKIERTRSSKVRQAKLYYLRGRIGKKAKLKGVEAYAAWEEPAANEESQQDEVADDIEVSTREKAAEEPENSETEATDAQPIGEPSPEVVEVEEPVAPDASETTAVDTTTEESPAEASTTEETSETLTEDK
jgi:hypothetical protein